LQWKAFLSTTSPLSTSMIHISEEKLKRREIRSLKIRMKIFISMGFMSKMSARGQKEGKRIVI
jgi:hypothetical protein